MMDRKREMQGRRDKEVVVGILALMEGSHLDVETCKKNHGHPYELS